MSSIRRADQISKIAYWAYLLLGLGILIHMILLFLFEQLGQLLIYFFFLIIVGLGLGTIAVILSIVRQRWGTEWKLLALLASTAIYVSIVFMVETGQISPWWDAIAIVSFSAVISVLPIWYFVSDRRSPPDD